MVVIAIVSLFVHLFQLSLSLFILFFFLFSVTFCFFLSRCPLLLLLFCFKDKRKKRDKFLFCSPLHCDAVEYSFLRGLRFSFMPCGYKSETGSVIFSAAAFVSLFFLPSKLSLLGALPAYVAVSRFIARGSRCRARPPSVLSSEETQTKFSFVFYPSLPLEKRPVCIITGTNSGIGFCTAVGLAAEGYEVIITCRTASLTADVAKRIKKAAQKLRASHAKKYSNAPDDVIVVGKMPIECDNFDSVRAFVSWFRENYEDRNLQVLVNNAGMMRKTLCFSAFNSQLELHTAVNFLGPLLLTELLLPFLERHGGRVVYVSSEAHRFPQTTLEKGLLSLWKRADPHSEDSLVGGKLLRALQDLNQGAEKCTGPFAHSGTKNSFSRYGTSKLLNTYHAHHIARRYCGAPKGKRVYACSLHPGCVSSGFQKDLIQNNLISTFFAVTSLLFLKTGEEGAQTSLHCAMCPVESLELITPTGASNCNDKAVSPYFAECTEKTRSLLLGYGWDIDEAEKVVAWGKKLVNL